MPSTWQEICCKNYNLIINTDYSDQITRKYFNKKTVYNLCLKVKNEKNY